MMAMRLRMEEETITPADATSRWPSRSATAPNSGCRTDELNDREATNRASVSSLTPK